MADVQVSIGCGKERKPGFIGLDVVDFGWNRVWDARKDRMPIEDSSVDFIEAHNFLEHVAREHWRHLFNECHRVLKPDGILEIITPDASVNLQHALNDPTHVALVVPGMFSQYLTGGRPRNADYGFKRWIINDLRHYDEKCAYDIFVRLQPKKK